MNVLFQAHQNKIYSPKICLISLVDENNGHPNFS